MIVHHTEQSIGVYIAITSFSFYHFSSNRNLDDLLSSVQAVYVMIRLMHICMVRSLTFSSR